MVVAAILGLLLSLYSVRCPPAYADAMKLPAGSVVIPKDKLPVTLDLTHFLVTRSQANNANAAAATSRRLTAQLVDCTRQVVRVTRPEPQWRVAVRWTVTGLALGLSFWAGTKIGGAR